MKLNELLAYDDIIVQCHDNPDADAISSGYALWFYLRYRGKNARFIYSGRNEITKSNLVLLKETYNIPSEYVTALDTEPELLVTVDCQCVLRGLAVGGAVVSGRGAIAERSTGAIYRSTSAYGSFVFP